jgi:HEAT repeat protein
MTKHRRQTLIAALTVLSLSITSPALIVGTAWAQTQQEKEAATLINQLKTADEFTRDETVQALAELGKPAIPALIKALESDSFIVRQGAAEALRQIGDPAIPALIKALDSKNARIRWNAVLSISNICSNETFSALSKHLKEPNVKIRRIVANSLYTGKICTQEGPIPVPEGTLASHDIPLLSLQEIIFSLRETLLKDPDAQVRSSVASALGSIGPTAKDAVPDLVQALNDTNPQVRSNAASALEKMGTDAKDAVPDLIKALHDQDAEVRSNVVTALGSMGTDAKLAIPDIVKVLKDDKDEWVRGSSVSALANIARESETLMPYLLLALKDKDAIVRSKSVYILETISLEDKTAIFYLAQTLRDQDSHVHTYTAKALGRISLELQKQANTLPPKDLDQAIKYLEIALQKSEQNKANFSTEDIEIVRLSLNALKAKRNANLTYLIRQYPWATGILFYLLFFPSLWFLIFWLRPRWLLHISSTLKPYEFKLPETWGGAPVRIRDLTFLSFFVYQPRVLDAWVAKQITTVREEFPKLETVKRRTTYVPVSVELDDQKISQLTPTNLQEIFQKKRICLLIWGEGGIGKTSIACQMAQWAMEADTTKSLCKHPMIPILIEEELDNQIITSKDAFLEAIRGQLKTLTHHPTPIDETLLKHLLQQRRLLVMVDHFSELSETTQKQIDPDAAEFPVNALVVTSRLENSLGKINKTNLHPLRIEGAELSDFMQKYLDKLGKLHLLTAPQFHYICGDLAKLLEEIKAQGRSTTVLFAKLYADVLIAKLEGNQDGMLPETIPDLMLSYLNELNRDVNGNKLTDRMIHQDAKAIAWECLKATYRPTPAKIREIMATLAALNPQDIELRLNYLEDKLRLIQTVGSAKDKIKFSLDPVAEYLAGLYLVEQYGKDDQKWQNFLQDADNQAGSPDAIKGFLLAVRDCYLAKLESAKPTDFLPQEIAKRCIPATATPPKKVPVGSP